MGTGAGRARSPRIAVLLASTAAALGAVELGLRVAGYEVAAREAGGRDRVLRPLSDPELLYDLEPGATTRLAKRAVTINRAGFRDREYDREKPAGTTRVVALGDSITFGSGLDVERTWSWVLEEELDRADGAGPVEVLNLGVAGYDALQVALFFERAGLAWSPDHAVVAYCVNDLTTASVNLDRLDRIARLDRGPLSWSRLAQWAAATVRGDATAHELRRARDARLDERFAGRFEDDEELLGLRAAIARELAAIAPTGDGIEARQRRLLELYTRPERLQRLRAAFARLGAAARRHGVEPWLFVVPFLADGDYTRAWRAAYDLVERLAADEGLRVVDVRGALEDQGLAARRLSEPDPVHPDARAHRSIARSVARALAGGAGGRQ